MTCFGSVPVGHSTTRGVSTTFSSRADSSTGSLSTVRNSTTPQAISGKWNTVLGGMFFLSYSTIVSMSGVSQTTISIMHWGRTAHGWKKLNWASEHLANGTSSPNNATTAFDKAMNLVSALDSNMLGAAARRASFPTDLGASPEEGVSAGSHLAHSRRKVIFTEFDM